MIIYNLQRGDILKKDDFDIKVFSSRFSELLEQSNENTHSLAKKLGLSPATISRYANGIMAPKLPTLYAMADIFDVNPIWLFGFDVPRAKQSDYINLPPPNITEDYTEIPVIGEIAAGYNHIAYENWEGETVPIPNHYLRGHDCSEFFVLTVKGSSMYPLYQDGDQVLILKQSTLNHSGQIGAILYNDECATLKKVEYVMGEDWLKLIPINPNYEPELIEGEALEHCRVIGIPKLLVRDIKD